ncbi:uncharacterized protein LOC144166734 [Haemaphysalis longicornis]
MTVLSQRHLSGEEEKLFLKQERDQSVWVAPSGRGVAMYAANCNSTIIQADAGCLQGHNVICASDNMTDTTATTEPLPKCYGCDDPSLQLTGVSDSLKYKLKHPLTFSNEEEFLENLNDALDIVNSPDDFEVLPNYLGRMVEGHQQLHRCPDHEDKAKYNKKIADTLVKIVEKTMLKTNILKGVPEDRRVRTASCLFSIVEDFVQQNLSRSR